ncbi:hypothetical protein V6N13_146721 [Hibiscus sabdariffa]
MLKLHLLCATISSKKLYLKLWKLKQKSVWKSVTSEAFFKATDKEVCKRLVELEMRSGDNLKEKKATVRRILSCNKASVLFIQESKLDSVNERTIRVMCGSANNMDWLFSPAVGSAGGLISLWNPNVFECLSSKTQRNYIVLEASSNSTPIVYTVFWIDRFLISSEVLRAWPDIVQTILPKNISDHNLISLSAITQNWGPKPFKWFDHWADDKGLVESVRNACQKKKGAGIGNMLRECKLASKTWLVRRKQSEPDSIPALESKITNLEAACANGDSDHNQIVELQVTRT